MRYSLLLLLPVWMLLACHKDQPAGVPSPTYPAGYELKSQPQALAENDASNYGIYKGVVINAQDSTATFKFNLYNNHPQPYALFYRNHKVYDSLIRYRKDTNGNMLIPQVADTTRIPLNGSFYYTYFSSYRIGGGIGALAGFNVTAQGQSYLMDVQLYGNASLEALLKEKSNRQVFCYEGSYSGLDSGRIAFALTADTLVGIRASVWNPQFYKVMTAPVSNNSFTINQYDDVSGNTFIFRGTVQNNTCTGTWTRSSQPSVTNQFSAVRTL